jgi:hypothetical protein
MNRRALLKYTAYLTGYAVAAPLSSAIFSGCKAEAPTTPFIPAFFTDDEYQHLSAMINTMLPPTATPGAVALGVPQFVDLVLSVYSEAEDKDKVREGLGTWSADVKQQSGKPYYELSPAEQLSLLNQLDAAARERADAITAADQQYIQQYQNNNVEKDEESPWWLMLKEIAIGGYYSSEKIGTEVLAYDPVPGPYQGCIPLEEVGNAWSLD